MADDGPAERITGIGGIFFRSQDPKALGEWYRTHLGVPVDEAGHAVIPESRHTVWSPFSADTDYWPAEKELMAPGDRTVDFRLSGRHGRRDARRSPFGAGEYAP